MEIKKTEIEGLYELFPDIFEDDRGFFFESFNQEKFNEVIPNVSFIQDNQSYSKAKVLRGLHFQNQPFGQGKLVRVVSGRVLDVVVDLRRDSSTYGKHYKVLLEGEKNNMLYVPTGFAHGFATLEPSVFSYKCTNTYNKKSEGGILWNDPDLNIDWEVKNPIVSEKDQVLGLFKDLLS
jgi:dTDP-4-dehydrorhamnose 3,5-epimerase